MDADSLEDLRLSVDNIAETFRRNDLEWRPYVFREEYTNWIEEQRAVRNSVAIVDQSYHMEVLWIRGPEAADLLEKLAVNSFEKIRSEDPPQAMNYLTCGPSGHVIGDLIVFYTGENEFLSVGSEWINNWIRYNGEVRDYDADLETPYHPFDEHDPPHFRFQIQGPNALNLMEEVVDGDLPHIPFFQMETIEINGAETYALSHGMAAMPGLEIFGDYEYHDSVIDDIFAAGDEYDIRQLGSAAYKTGKIGSGWFVAAVPAIYTNEEMRGYREWLEIDTLEAQLSIGGSFESEDITDYYMTPMEQGKAHLVDFEHDFIGKEALEDMIDNQERQRVTLVWDDRDVIDVYASLFEEGQTNQFIHLPDVATRWSAMHYDTVLKDGDVVGLSKYPGYLYYQREMLSLATIDLEYAEPGTEVAFLWGDQSAKRGVERNEQIEISATVAPAPYVEGGRRNV